MNQTRRLRRVSRCVALLFALSPCQLVTLSPCHAAPAPDDAGQTSPPPRPAPSSPAPERSGGVTEKTQFPQWLELPARPSQKTSWKPRLRLAARS